MNKVLKKFSTKISIYFLISAILLLFLLSYRYYQYSVDLIRSNKIEETKQQLSSASAYISSYLEKIKGMANFLSMTPAIKDIKQEKHSEIESLIELSNQNDPLINRIIVVYKNGTLISNDNVQLPLAPNMEEIAWYRQLHKNQNNAIVTTENYKDLSMNKSERIISINQAIIKDKEIIGYVIIDLSYKFVEEYVSLINFGEKGYTFITTGQEKLIFDSKQMESNYLVEQDKYKLIIKNRMKMIEPGFIASKVEIPGTDWLLVGVASNEEVEILKDKLITNTSKLILFILFASIALSVLISKWISKPLTNLVEEMKKIDENFNKIELLNSDLIEINTLKKEYNNLLDRIKVLTLNIEEKEHAKRVFEVKALQSQINPHFIYNTLETILWLIEFKENDKAIEVVKSLGTILRNTLNINQDFIELEKEFKYVKHYMDIQKVRYDDKFDYYFEIDKSIYDLMIPKFILQPIVENAIYHGIKPKESKSFIRIKAYIDDEQLIIRVENDGLDFNQNDSLRIKTKVGGIGISNVSQRIKILCGEQYGLKMYRKDDITVVEYNLSI